MMRRPFAVLVGTPSTLRTIRAGRRIPPLAIAA